MNNYNDNLKDREIFVISDTHFGQWFANWFFDRPFKNVDDMNEQLIKNWNSVVGVNDIIIIVGDFYAGNKNFLNQLIDKLHGEKILVKGNHDFKYRYRKLIKEQKIEVYNKLIFNYNDLTLIFSHIALPFVSKNTLNIHGHYHRKLRPINLSHKNYYNVCVEHNEYKPVNIRFILSHYYNTEDIDFSISKLLEAIKLRYINNYAYLLS